MLHPHATISLSHDNQAARQKEVEDEQREKEKNMLVTEVKKNFGSANFRRTFAIDDVMLAKTALDKAKSASDAVEATLIPTLI